MTWLFVVYMIRQWIGLGAAVFGGWLCATPQLPTHIGCVVGVLCIVGAILVLPPFDFIKMMQEPSDD